MKILMMKMIGLKTKEEIKEDENKQIEEDIKEKQPEEQKEKEEPKAYDNLVKNIVTGLTSDKKPEKVRQTSVNKYDNGKKNHLIYEVINIQVEKKE